MHVICGIETHPVHFPIAKQFCTRLQHFRMVDGNNLAFLFQHHFADIGGVDRNPAVTYIEELGTAMLRLADVIAFEKALEYIKNIGFKNILEHDQELLKYAREKLSTLPGIQLYGPKDLAQAGGILSFNIPGVHPHDIGSILNEEGIAIRAGHSSNFQFAKKLYEHILVENSHEHA